MDEKRMVIVGVGAVLVVSTITLLAVTMSATDGDAPDATEAPYINRTNPLLLISFDGFRSNYISRYVPTLEELANDGVTAPYMMPVYPTLAFPNHYTIVTGLYPALHGIVADQFYDPDYDERFEVGNKDNKWWGGEPIWNTLTRQNKTSATYYWPGSDCNISGLYPTYWYTAQLHGSTPYTDRVDQVVKWLSMSEEERPDFVSLYFEEPDRTGHEFGPSSLDMDNKLVEMDGLISRLMTGLRNNNLVDKVNIIVLSDHGMVRSAPYRCLNLTEYVSDFSESTTQENVYGSFTTLRLRNTSNEAIKDMLTKLACPKGEPSMRAYVPRDLPTRFHYTNNKRIGDIVLDLDSGYYTNGNSSYLGQHGYDNHLSYMGALFIATGPDFKKNVTLQPFQNIELYNLMCHLTGVEPAPNNGTQGTLYDALLDPPPIPEVPLEDYPPAATYPDNLTDDVLTMANCDGDESMTATWLEALNIPENEQQQLETLHLPWGIPLQGNISVLSSDILLLHHQDHITGYSEKRKMPLWTSFTVSKLPVGTQYNSSWWCSDVRLTPDNTATCNSHDNITVEGRMVFNFPLFQPWFSVNDTLEKVPYLVSNAVPLYTTSKTLDYATTVLTPLWTLDITPFNLMFGLVFDNDADSLPDDFTNFTVPEVPSDIFIVVTRCRQLVEFLGECKEEDVDTHSFIFPTLLTVNNECTDYAAFFLSTLRDVELATGLTFFSDLEPSVRLQLALRIHTKPWYINLKN